MNKLYELAFSIPGYGSVNPPPGIPGGGLTTLQKVIRNGITIALIFTFALALIFLIWGGISWTLAGGDKQKIHTARLKIVYALVGIVMVLLSFFILSLVGRLFGIDILSGGSASVPCPPTRPGTGPLPC